ncbi:MAG: carboxylesterase family protein [Erysipelotrichaceae bacterium]|nr:carboxylesterase family protein [Erysipelotrichaceae bacterium]
MNDSKQVTIDTPLIRVRGTETDGCRQFLGIPYAKAERFRYAEMIENYEETVDALSFGSSCPQYRQYFPQLDNPERLFYHKEFREGIEFHYDEDCLNLNIFTPAETGHCPVAVFIHGGGFNSGSNQEEPFRGCELARRGIITVFVNYRVGVFGYLTHEEIQNEYGRDGNFGLDDQRTAVKWVKKFIGAFGGDPDNITLFGQSAGAISIQYLLLDHRNAGLFRRVFMMSGAGLFPKFALPRKAEDTREYWLQLMEKAGCSSLDELRALGVRELLTAAQEMKQERKDTLYNTMPVIDGYLLNGPVDLLIRNPIRCGCMIGYTNNDMYAPLMAYIGNQYGRKNDAYIYFFDKDAPGDNNGAFHSCDLRYLFGRLEQSWRPYTERDYEISRQMTDYFASFAKTGNPNGKGRPGWQQCRNGILSVLRFTEEKTAMGSVPYRKLSLNMIRKGNPKA